MLTALLTGGALAASWISGAAAQEAALMLRGATLDAAGPAGSLRIGRPAQTKPLKKARQSRSPTVVPVRVETRKPVVSPYLVREVQPTLTGLPDPTTPLPLPRRRIRDDDPYGQVSYRFGGLKLYPAIEEDIGYDSNPNRVAPPAKGSFVSRTGGELRVQSHWSNHELSGYLR